MPVSRLFLKLKKSERERGLKVEEGEVQMKERRERVGDGGGMEERVSGVVGVVHGLARYEK